MMVVARCLEILARLRSTLVCSDLPAILASSSSTSNLFDCFPKINHPAQSPWGKGPKNASNGALELAPNRQNLLFHSLSLPSDCPPGILENMPLLKAYILDRFAGSNANYTSWMNACPVPCRIIDDFCPNWVVPADAGIIITHMHYRWEEIHALRRIVETGKYPVLILADGMLEYRNTWQNPNLGDGSIFQPVIGHKLACLGRGQARAVESWGNIGKCEIVGLPRLDSLATSDSLPIQNTGPFRLLIATANTPAFTTQQRATVVESLQDLYQRVVKNPWVDGRPLEVCWRLTDGLAQVLGLPDKTESRLKAYPLSDLIEKVDAVITSPSTLYFESVLRRRPTAVLDYSNSPQYVPAAWTISAPRQLGQVLSELAQPPAAKLQFQRSCLHDQLECATPATPRLLTLIDRMIELGVQSRRNDQSLKLPARILADAQLGFAVVESEFDPATLYPDNPTFRQLDPLSLQVELNQAICRLGQLPTELDKKNSDVIRKNKHITDLKSHLADAWERIGSYREKESQHEHTMFQRSLDMANKNEHIKSMEQHLQTALERVQELRQELKAQTSFLAQIRGTLAERETKLELAQKAA